VNWTDKFLGLASHIAAWSKDTSTKVGCVVVGPQREVRSTGYNGFPRGVADSPERLGDRAQKYPRIVHAEENAVAQAARVGAGLLGCTAYVSFPPCARCARMLIQAGVVEVVAPAAEVPERWAEEIRVAKEMFAEAGVRYWEAPCSPTT